MKKLLLAVVFIVLVLASATYLYLQNQNTPAQTNTPTTEEIYSIKLVTDNKGMYSKVSNVTYSGTTKIEVLKGDKVIITLAGVDGIGSNPLCSEVSKFEDTSAEYLNALATAAKENGGELQINNLVGKSFTEFNLFGLRARLVNNNIYFNKSTNTNTNTSLFNPNCGFSAVNVEVPELSFNAKSNINNSNGIQKLYRVEVSENDLSSQDLINLKEYLDNLKI